MIKNDCVMYSIERKRCMALKMVDCTGCRFYKNATMYSKSNKGISYEEEMEIIKHYVNPKDMR